MSTSSGLVVAVTGATGFLGRHTVAALLAAGHNLEALLPATLNGPQSQVREVPEITGMTTQGFGQFGEYADLHIGLDPLAPEFETGFRLSASRFAVELHEDQIPGDHA